MSYATTLYAVDLDQLRAAIGSRDAKLFARVKRKCLNEPERRIGRLIRIEFDDAGTLLLANTLPIIANLRPILPPKKILSDLLGIPWWFSRNTRSLSANALRAAFRHI